MTTAFLKSENKFDLVITIIFLITIITAIFVVIYVIVNPVRSEKFTEFYLLSSEGKTIGYPQNFSMGENQTIIIGLANHESKTMNYTVEIWLMNETTEYINSTKTNQTIYHNMWFMDNILVTLNSTPVDTDKPWTTQWQYNYTFTITKKGDLKLMFLLFTTPTESSNQGEDYANIVAEKIENAYQELYLWVSTRI
jgi:uncharacterized membrane protein